VVKVATKTNKLPLGLPVLAWDAGGLRGKEHLIANVAFLDNAGSVLVAELPVKRSRVWAWGGA
jgi:hypothetical protein